ncbi:SH3 domain-binding protein 2 [Ostrinia nubilalis]|uniref:SH3 domain-binding protein 2 n=1 Tax=Ostrinia nubilalis TaxID=29057 RepID=UPI00308244EC
MPQCKTDFETFRNELNCNEFFVCVNRKPVKFQCPADLAYSPKFGVCDYPALVDCSSSSTFIPPGPPQPPAPSTSAPAASEPPSLTTKPLLFPRPDKPSLANLPTIPQIGQFPGGSWTRPAPQETDAPGFQFNPNLSDGNAIFMQNSIYNSHNFATPVAIMSPQDAIRYLKLNNIPEVNSSQ